MKGDLLYWKNNQELMEELKLEQTSGQWGLLIDSSKFSLKTVLLHNVNHFPSIPLTNAVHIKDM